LKSCISLRETNRIGVVKANELGLDSRITFRINRFVISYRGFWTFRSGFEGTARYTYGSGRQHYVSQMAISAKYRLVELRSIFHLGKRYDNVGIIGDTTRSLQHTTPSTKAIRLWDILWIVQWGFQWEKFFVEEKANGFTKEQHFICGDATMNTKPQLEIFCWWCKMNIGCTMDNFGLDSNVLHATTRNP
jgi:hypothetical protein